MAARPAPAALILVMAALAGCGRDDGPTRVEDARRPAPTDAGADAGDAYVPAIPTPAGGCAPSGATSCRDVCRDRVTHCGDHSPICLGMSSQKTWFSEQCTALCEVYPTFRRLACDATRCDAFSSALVDLVPSAMARCQAVREDELIDACIALEACGRACQAQPADAVPGCEARCATEAGPLADAAAARLTPWQSCLGICLTEGCAPEDCADFRCRCAHDACFDEGVPGESALHCLFHGAQRPAGDACSDAGVAGDTGRRCGELVECLDRCDDDRGCVRRCVREASADAFARYTRAMRCEAESPCLDRAECRVGECAEPWSACLLHDLSFGAGDCNFLTDCARRCDARPGDRYCNQACRAGATREANAAFDALLDCMQAAGCSLGAGCEACAAPADRCRGL